MSTPVTIANRATIIRSHDRTSFKQCRVRWNYSSFNRMAWQKEGSSIPLDFGTAIHNGLDLWYNPEKADDDKEFVLAEAQAIFADKLRKLLIPGGIAPLDVQDHENLGRLMLAHYVAFWEREDRDWEPIYREIPFSVPIPLDLTGGRESENVTFIQDQETERLYLAERVWEDGLGWTAQPVFLQGQLDLIFKRRSTGKLWVIDHKTAASIDVDGYDYLELDTQSNTYYWVVRKSLNLDVDGIMFNFLKKQVPDEPPLIKSGKRLVMDQKLGTTVALYNKAIERHGFDPSDYAEFLTKYKEPTFFHREPIYKDDSELETIERDLVAEAEDIINADKRIYPNPSQMNCKYCPFKYPCKIRLNGGNDVDWISASGLYVKNTSYGKLPGG